MTRKRSLLSIRAAAPAAALLGLFLLTALLAGCQAARPPVTKEQAPVPEPAYRLSSVRLPFDPGQVRKDIGDFITSRTAPNGLIASFTDTSTFAFDCGNFYNCVYGKQGYLDEQAFTYDLALAVIGLLLSGRTAHAEKLLSTFEKEFYLPKNNTYGFFNSYLVTSNIPAEDLTLGIDGDRIHAGPSLWVAIAALNHMKLQRNTRYLEFVLDIVHWCRTELAYYKFPDGERGAISMGMGWGPQWSKIFSTEHNVDYFSVLRILHEIYAESPEDVRAIFREKGIEDAWLTDEMEHVGRWLREVVFNRELYCFMAGVNEYGVDQLRILDGTSWGIAGVGPENFVKWGIDLDRLIASNERIFQAEHVLPDGRVISGFDFTDNGGYEGARTPLVWFEGTGQLIIAYKELGRYYAEKGDESRAKYYEDRALLYTQNVHDFSYAYGLQGGLPYMAVRPQEKQIIKTLKWEWEIPRGRNKDTWVKSVSSTMWFLYTLHDFYNPMKWGKN